MPPSLSRRNALTVGALSTGGMSGDGHAVEHKDTWDSDFLQPFSPGEEVERNLIPGNTPIRLSCGAYCLHYADGTDIGARVREIRAAGYTACEADDSWKKSSDADIRELRSALREHDLWFYTIHSCVNNIHPDLAERRKINKQVAENVECAERLRYRFRSQPYRKLLRKNNPSAP